MNPDSGLSFQSHNHRSELWIVVEGTVKVTVYNEIQILTEGQSIFIPCGALRLMENIGRVPIILMEVQIGEYLSEDDIIRYEDIYSRD